MLSYSVLAAHARVQQVPFSLDLKERRKSTLISRNSRWNIPRPEAGHNSTLKRIYMFVHSIYQPLSYINT